MSKSLREQLSALVAAQQKAAEIEKAWSARRPAGRKGK